MTNLYDALEDCLQGLENGADLNSVLARYPELARELRPVLKTSIQARGLAAPEPAPEVARRGRAKLLQQAATMREAKIAPRRRVIPFFQRLAISFALTASFLMGGTSLVGASSAALPGEKLYPVKRTWEGLRLFFVFDARARNVLENQLEGERLHEVSKLLEDGRYETIQFAGAFTQTNGVAYVSGVTVLLPTNLSAPANGAAVMVSGRTNAQGFVEVESIETLPAGAIVPAGQLVKMDAESGSNQQSFEMTGTIETISNNTLIINGQTVYLDSSTTTNGLKSGVDVEIKGYYTTDGDFKVTEVKVKDSQPENNNDSSNNSGSGDNGGSNPTSGTGDNGGSNPTSGSGDNGGSNPTSGAGDNVESNPTSGASDAVSTPHPKSKDNNNSNNNDNNSSDGGGDNGGDSGN
jgi:hypothetical protein